MTPCGAPTYTAGLEKVLAQLAEPATAALLESPAMQALNETILQSIKLPSPISPDLQRMLGSMALPPHSDLPKGVKTLKALQHQPAKHRRAIECRPARRPAQARNLRSRMTEMTASRRVDYDRNSTTRGACTMGKYASPTHFKVALKQAAVTMSKTTGMSVPELMNVFYFNRLSGPRLHGRPGRMAHQRRPGPASALPRRRPPQPRHRPAVHLSRPHRRGGRIAGQPSGSPGTR